MKAVKRLVIEMIDDLLAVAAIVATIVTSLSAICLLDDFINMLM